MLKNNTCSLPRCSANRDVSSGVIYYGKWICERCFNKYESDVLKKKLGVTKDLEVIEVKMLFRGDLRAYQ